MTEMRLWRGLALLSAALYCGIAWMWLVELIPGARGLTPFDARFFGYTPADGTAYMNALADDARAVYLGDVRLLDTIFPIALAALLAWPLLRLPTGAWRVLAILPLGYLAADLIENARVAKILLAEAATADMFIAASQATVAKYGFLIISMIALGAVYVTTRRP